MEEKRRCLLCGALAIDNYYCKSCEEKLNKNTVKEILYDEEALVKLITKNGCMACPLYETKYCEMIDEHITCKNAEDEIALCFKYFKKWFNSGRNKN